MYSPGIETLDLKALKGAKVGLLSHQAATVTTGEDSATWLHRHLGPSLAALFAPEHGFFGLCSAGEHSPFRVHPQWKIPVWSLYGDYRAPTAEMLKGLDVLIVDLQDLAVRCYTYLATLQLTLQVAAQSHLPIIVCDRPHPFAHPDGPRLNPQYQSFVAPCDLPMVYAKTQGEAAKSICAIDNLSLDLTICAAEGDYLPCTFPSSLDFIPPSPAIRTWQSAQLFPLTVFTEALPAVDCDRKGSMAFRVVSLDGIASEHLAAELSRAHLSGLACSPFRYVSNGKERDGVRFFVTNFRDYRPISASIHLLSILTRLRPDIWQTTDARPEWFDKLYGGSTIRTALLESVPPADIIDQWSGTP